MTIKATHNGTCQVCGREQALPGGVLSKHGYDVQFHYFRGVCPGAGAMPLEHARDIADEVAANLLVTSRIRAKDAVAVLAGELLPKSAKSGLWIKVDGRTQQEMVPFADAPEQYRKTAVASLHHMLDNESRECARVSKAITDRANQTTGIKAITPRAEEPVRKVIVPGTKFMLHGIERTALRVESRQAMGVGPFLNGNYMPHVVFAHGDKERAYPVRLIRQAAIKG